MRIGFRIFFIWLWPIFWGCESQNTEGSPLHQEDDPHKGLTIYFENVRQFPDSVLLYEQLIDTLANCGLFAEAAAWCDSAQSREKRFSVGWLLAKGDLYRMGKQFDSAISAYNTYLTYFPDDEQVLLNLANAYAEKGDPKALLLCNRIAEMNPGKETRSNTAFIAGMYHNIKGQYATARMWFDSAISLQYQFVEAWMERGYSFYDEEKYTEAQNNFSQLTRINSSNAEAWYWLAKSYEAAGNTDDAIASYSRAYSLDRNLLEARISLERLRNK